VAIHTLHIVNRKILVGIRLATSLTKVWVARFDIPPKECRFLALGVVCYYS